MFEYFLYQQDDGIVEKLSRKYTSCLFLLSSVLVLLIQRFQDPIVCSFPDVFSSSQISAGTDICFWKDNYQTSRKLSNEHDKIFNIHKWLPCILLLQAISFFLPCILWRIVYTLCGKNLSQFVNEINYCNTLESSDVRQRKLEILGSRILGRSSGFLSITYGLIKLLYLINAVGQMILLAFLLNWGTLLFKFAHFLPIPKESYLSLLVSCHYKIGKYEVSADCVLQSNHWNGAMACLLVIWLVALIPILLFDAILWLIDYCRWPDKFLREHLSSYNKEDEDLAQFKMFYLNRDTEFILKIIAENSGYFIVSELVWKLWDYFSGKFPYSSPDAPPYEITDDNEQSSI
ncbi:unnamed protein product [Dimorphilus gyrociliatus]|uniref:Innexin n=1 Tax=Dimorphilus gyrociliatus TaxID=2664684 RepID=A0A7I8VTJ5_9ANNE|nr:unnamed protein product [Dimorphilus gyrociliatus]